MGYADDLALVVVANSERQLMNSANLDVHLVIAWLQMKGLEIEPEKTEAILMAGRRALAVVSLMVDGVVVNPVKKLKYSGVWLDHRRSFQVHFEEMSKKCTNVGGSLSRLMGNVNGPMSSKRKVVASVVE